MFPLLLLLLLPESLAYEVCMNISNGNINVNLSADDVSISDSKNAWDRSCVWQLTSCLIECTMEQNASRVLSGTNACPTATLLRLPSKIEFNISTFGKCILHLCNEAEVLQLVKDVDTNTGQKGMTRLYFIRDSCRQLFKNNHKIKKLFINVERRLIHDIMKNTQLTPGGSKQYNLKYMALYVVKIADANLTGAAPNGRIEIVAPQLLPQNMSSIPKTWLPVDNLRNIREKERVVGLVSYMWHDQFLFEQEHISSMVTRIELLGEKHFANLTTSVRMIFNVTGHTSNINDSGLQCNFFEETEYRWKTDGCETHIDAEVECNCNHTTPFSVLLIREPIGETHWRILSYISYIGCGLSAFFTALSLITYVFSRARSVDHSTSIHVSLSGALFLLNSTFLLSDWVTTVELDWVCVFIAAVMHYSLLCCFTWMAIEALHLYMLLIKVFNTHYKHYLAKLSLTGWGIPGIIVGVSVGVSVGAKDGQQLYGFAEITMVDTNQTNKICWIVDNSFFYGLNVVYFTIIFLFNTSILLAVACRICKLKRGSECKPGHGGALIAQRRALCKIGLTVAGLTCLLGTTWGLAFLGSGHLNYPILYLFCIFNSTQGFFIFLWICGTTRKDRKRAEEARISSAALTSLEVKSKQAHIPDGNSYR